MTAPLQFVPHPVEGLETVLLGVVPIGTITRMGGRCYWSLELPLAPRMRRALSPASARADVERAVEHWLEAALSAPQLRNALPAFAHGKSARQQGGSSA